MSAIGNLRNRVADSRGDFWKQFDRYANPVTLTYLKKGKYETAAGGICSIFSFTLLAYWLVVNVFYALANYGSYTVSTKTGLVRGSDGFPEFKLTDQELSVAYNMVYIGSDQMESSIDSYVKGVWI